MRMLVPRTQTWVAAVALVALLAVGAPLRADEEDCETVLKDLTDAIEIATKNFETTMDELKKMAPSGDDKTKAVIKNKFCSAIGEYLGTSRAFRAVTGECLEGAKRTEAVAEIGRSVRSLEASIDDTCK